MGIINSQRSYLPRAGMFIGLFGAISFLVFIANYTLDWSSRYNFMLFLIPLPVASLFIAWKKPFIGGALLIALGVIAVLLDINITIGVVGYIAGLGLGYTLFFVTLPLITSGVFFIVSGRERRRQSKAVNEGKRTHIGASGIGSNNQGAVKN